ncbi:MAG TPA: amidohydrolase family protein [Bryobacteraceae bacterium]|nr:amidohydrolase family protein [Bryobacteraceae bacterium]
MRVLKSALALVLALPLFAETKVFTNFTLIDGTGRPAQAAMSMIVVDGRIRAIGPAARIKAPAGAETIDCSGKFVMPGIINSHGHVGSTHDMEQGPQFYTKENVEKQLAVYASYGVTTVMSLGTDLQPALDVRAEERATGRPHFARLYDAGMGFTLKGGTPPTQGLRYAVATPADVPPIIDKLAAEKVDMVKIWVDDGFGRGKKVPPEISSVIIADAKKHGLRTAVHIVDYQDAKNVIDEGAYVLAHSVRDRPVDQALIDDIKSHHAWQIATLTRELSTYVFADRPAFLEDPFLTRSLSPVVLETVKSEKYISHMRNSADYERGHELLKMAERNLKTESDAGVQIAMGTDTGPPARFQGFFEHLEMQLMVESGLTPMQVIVDSTRNGAEFLGAKDLGTLERGKWADLLVLNKNPLEDIKNTRTIEAVYIAGNKVN